MSMQGLLNNGDEILMPSPDYPLWTAAANLAGGHPVHYMCDEAANWYPDMDDIRSKITDRTKGIVIINPNNPTGAFLSARFYGRDQDIAREHQLIILLMRSGRPPSLWTEREHISTLPGSGPFCA